MQNLSPRQREILMLIQEKDFISVEEIQQITEIAQATAYREIQALVRLGLVNKVPGGISLAKNTASQRCVQCGRENNPRTTFLIEQVGGEQVAACCAHCGLMAVARRSNISMAMTADFFYGTMVNVSHAWYVLNSDLSVCCRPSAVSFSSQEDARRLVVGFGGEVLDFEGAQNKVKEMMAFKQQLIRF
jgi:DeoR/GlpR family transcriptional regulator of sugar metabolism